MSVTTPKFGLREICVRRGGRTVLDVDALSIAAGRVSAVVGPNGAGKSTLLRVLGLLLAPDRGEVEIDGRRLPARRSELLVQRRAITYVAQSALLLRRTVHGNVAYGLKVRGEAVDSRVETALGRVGIEALAQRPAWRLSGGEAQRVTIARALAIDPTVYLFDEPTANVDREFVPVIESLLRELAAAGKTVVLSTHSLDQAYRLADQMISLNEGRLAPFPLVNLLRGVTERRDGTRFFVSGGIHIELPVDLDAQVVAIDPDSLIVAREPLHSSARNCVSGVVSRVDRDDRGLLLHIDCGQPLIARVTVNAYADLQLNVGAPVFVVFKASAVHVVTGDS